MTINVSQKVRNRIRQILFGTLVSGVLLFQGTGFVTQSLFGGDNQNIVINGSTQSVTTTDYNTGLTGPASAPGTASTAGQLSITGGATAVIGGLKTSTTNIDVNQAVNLTVTPNSDTRLAEVVVGDATTTVSKLYIAGTSTKTASSVTLTDGTSLQVMQAGVLQIGTSMDEGDTDDASGVLQVNNGAQLINRITQDAAITQPGIYVSSNGRLIFGNSETDLFTGNSMLAGFGVLQNYGVIDVYNESGKDNRLQIGTYADTTTGIIKSENGYVLIQAGTQTDNNIAINGTVNTDELGFEHNTTIGSTGVITVRQLHFITADADTPVTSASNAGSVSIEETFDWTPITLADESFAFTNTGTFVIGNMTLSENMTFTNNITSTTTGVVLQVNDTLNINDGKFVNTAGTTTVKTLTASNGSFEANGGTVTVSGDMTLSGGTSDDAGGVINVAGASSSATATFNVSGKTSISDYAQLNTSANSTTTLNELAVTGNGLVNTKGGTLNVTDATVSGGTMQTVSTDTSTSGTTTIGNLTLSDTGIVATSAGTTTITSLTQEGGTLTTSGGTVKIGGGTFSGGAINASAGTTQFTRGSFDGTVLTTSGGTTSFNGTEITKADSIIASGGTTTVTWLITDLETPSDSFMTVSGDAIVNVSGILVAKSGEININSSEADTDAFTVGENGILALTFETNPTTSLLNVTTGSVVLNEGSSIAAYNLDKLGPGTYYSYLANVSADDADNVNITDESEFYYGDDNLFFQFSKIENHGYKLDVKGFSSYALTPNQKEVAQYLDSARAAGQVGDTLNSLLLDTIMINYTNVNDVRQALTQLAAPQHANGLMLAMDTSWTHPFDQMVFSSHRNRAVPAYEYNSSYFRGQMPCNDCATDECGPNCGFLGSIFGASSQTAPHSVWASFYHTSFTGTEDGNSPEYGISQTGGAFGYDIVNSQDVVAGAMFGYSQPFLHSGGHRIETTSFQLGLYGGRKFQSGTELKLYAGLGVQQYISKRSVNIPHYSEYFRSDYDGRSFSFCAQLSHECMISCNSILRPLIQFDMQQVWQDGATESAGAAALVYDDASWNRSFVRVGAESELNGEFLQFTGRALYGLQLSGDTAPQARARFVDVNNAASWMTVQGVDLGSSFVDLGIGALGYFDCTRNLGISGNYDFIASDKSRSHTGRVSLTYLF
ncbi:MAG: autotransporter domain-containing protein [Thermoguttaceae bacterium]|nr:autotransporter domain-containing protein [Thermoguttaceae bacterium]